MRTQRTRVRKDEQRRMACRAWCWQVHSALIFQVNCAEVTKFNFHNNFLRPTSDRLPDLGLSPHEGMVGRKSRCWPRLALVLRLDLEQVDRFVAAQFHALHDPLIIHLGSLERPKGFEHLGLTIGELDRRGLNPRQCRPPEVRRERLVHRRSRIDARAEGRALMPMARNTAVVLGDQTALIGLRDSVLASSGEIDSWRMMCFNRASRFLPVPPAPPAPAPASPAARWR